MGPGQLGLHSQNDVAAKLCKQELKGQPVLTFLLSFVFTRKKVKNKTANPLYFVHPIFSFFFVWRKQSVE